MKRKLTVVFVILAAALLVFGAVACTRQDMSGKKTVTVINGSISETKTYDVGTTIILEAQVADGKEFEYWEVNGERFSEEKKLVYKVTTDVTIRSVFSDSIRTVQVINGDKNTTRSYAVGTKINFSADSLAGQKFICWVENETPLSYEKNVEYEVKGDAVVRAVYANDKQITLSYDGGKAEDETITVTAFGTETSYDGALLAGYRYTLPVPVKNRYKFVCWTVGDKAVTDKNGKSLAPYDGESTVFVAKYEENPFVYVVIKNSDTDETQRENKVYVEDGSAAIKADEIIDKACSGWDISYVVRENETDKTIRQSVSSASSFYFNLSQDFVVPGKTYTFYAKYREAYKVTIVSGSGGGAYAKEETIVLIAAVPTGKNFLDWTISYSGKTAVLARTDKGALCLVYEEGEEQKAVYFSEEEQAAVIVSATELNLTSIPESGTFTLAELEKLGITVSGGSNTLIRGRFEDKDYTFTYTLNCNVDGVYFLDEDGEKALIAAGFTKGENGTFVKVEYYNYNESIASAVVPSIAHYKFGGWQSAISGVKIPSAMPNYNMAVVGSFSAERHLIELVCPSGNGVAKIGGAGSTKSGYYAYGSTIEFYVTAYAGYEFYKWQDKDELDASGRVIDKGETVKAEQITYVFRYTVQKEEKFTCVFANREYEITYIFSIMYDGKDVTHDESFFLPNTYREDYAVKKTAKKYGEQVTLDPKYTIREKGLFSYDLSLVYEGEHWTVSDWVADGEGLDVSGKFTMPKKDVTVRSVCTIKYHNVTFSLKEGVVPSIRTINGKNPTDYKGGEEVYFVPYGSEFTFDVTLEKGRSLGAVQANSKVLDSSDDYRYTVDPADRYSIEAKFKLKIAEENVVYSFSSEEQTFVAVYYVRADFEQSDADNPLTGCVQIDESDVKIVDGNTYYKLDKLVAVGQSGYLQDATRTGLKYNQTLVDALIDASKARYDFGGWTRMVGEERYLGQTVPDEDIWAYGTLTLKKYTVEIEKDTFRFDGNPSAPVNTADVRKVVEAGTETDYEKGEYAVTQRLYFSEYTIKKHSPTGYNFTKWRISAGSGITDYADVDVSGAPVGTILSAVTYSGKYTIKYRVNDDDTFTLFLTENCSVKAEFDVKRFSAISLDETEIAAENGDEYSGSVTFEYGSRLQVRYSCRDKAISGKKVTAFVLSGAADMTDVKQSINTGFDEETLSYPYGTSTNPEAKGETDEFTHDVYVKAEVEDINYRIYYTVYTAADSLKGLSANSYATTCTAEDGTYYTVKLGQTVSVLGEEAAKKIAAASGLETAGTMYSGWYEKNALTSDDAEGTGFKSTGANADGTWNYTHAKKKGEEFAAHVYLSCYLIRLVKTYNGEGKLNNPIKDVPNYANYFAAHYDEITIPETGSDGKTVTKIAAGAFNGMKGLKKVTLPETVTIIGSGAFENCISLAETGLTSAITEIGASAYKGCSSLTEVTFGPLVASVGAKAFEDAVNVANIYYNSKTTTNFSAGAGVFGNAGANAGEITLTIGSAVTVVPGGLFGCDGGGTAEYLTKVVFEPGRASSVTLDRFAFAYSGLRTIEPNGRLRSVKSNAFRECKNFTEFDFEGSGLTAAEENAFSYSRLVTVILSEEVTSIEQNAFYACKDLESVYYRGQNGVTSIGEGAFALEGPTSSSALRRFTSIEEKENAAPADEIRLPSVAILGKWAFRGAASVKSLYLGGTGAKNIDVEVFYGASGITSIVYDIQTCGDVSSTESAPFIAMKSASEITLTLGENVRRVPARMFNNLAMVRKVTVPSTVTSIGALAFGNMNALREIYFDIEGDSYTMSDAAKPFFGSGSDDGMRVTFGKNVTKIKDYAFSGTTKLTSFAIEADGEKPVYIGANAFSDTGIASVNVPLRKSLEIGEYAFRSAPITTVTINENVAEVTIGAHALSDTKGAINRVSAFGKTMSGLWFAAESGKFSAVKTEIGVRATISGAIRTKNVVTVDREDELVVESGATLTIDGETTVRGKFLPQSGSTVLKEGDGTIFRAVAFDKDDFAEKNAYAEYTHKTIVGDVDFAEDLVVTGKEFSVDEGATVTFGGDFEYVVGDGSGSTFKVVTAANAKCVMSGKKLTANGKLVGVLQATAGTEVFVLGKRLLNNGANFADESGSGLRITSGTTEISSGGTTITYKVTEGELRINADTYAQESGYSIVVDGGATLAVDHTATLSSYSAADGAFLTVETDAILRLNGFAQSKENAKWAVNAAVSSLGNDVKSYFGSIERGFADSEDESKTLMLEKNATYETFSVTTPSVNTVLDFNGHSLSITSGGFILGGGFTIENADFTATDNGAAIISGGTTTGFVTIKSGKIKANGDVIRTDAELTVESEAEIISVNGVAADCVKATIKGGINGGLTGIFVDNKVGAAISISGTVESGSGTAVKAIGALLNVKLLSGGTIIGKTAVYIDETDEGEGKEGSFVAEEGSTITGEEAGAVLAGTGSYVISGAVVSTEERAFDAANLYVGALVIEEKELSSAGKNVTIKLTATAVISNGNGDAILYVGYGKENVSRDPSARETLVAEDGATIDGRKAAFVQVFDLTAGQVTDRELYEINDDGTITLKKSGNGLYEFNGERTRIIDGSKVVSLEYLPGSDKTVRYVTSRETVLSAFDSSDYARITSEGATIGGSASGTVAVNEGQTLIVCEDAEWLGGEVKGTLGIVGGTVTVSGAASASGRVLGINEESGKSEFVVNGSFVLKGESAQAELAKGMTINDGAVVNFGRKLSLSEGGVVLNKGTLTIGSSHYDPNEINIEYSSIDGTIETDGGTLTIYEDATIGNLTLKNAVFEVKRNDDGAEKDPVTNPKVNEITVKTVAISGTDVEFDGLFTIQEKLSLGANATFNEKVVINGRIVTEKPEEINALKVKGDGNVIKVSGDIRYDLAIEGQTKIDSGTDKSVSAYGKIKFNAKTEFVSGAESAQYGQVIVNGDQLSRGRLVFLDGADVYAEEVYLMNDGGIEYYSGTLTLSGVETGESGQIARAGLFIENRGWMFLPSADKIGTDSFVKSSSGGKITKSNVKVVRFEGKVYGKTSGITLSNCANSSYKSHGATCGEEGGDRCIYEYSGTLEDGTKFEIRHERKNVTPATGMHDFVPNSDGIGHYCRVCGQEEQHTYNNNEFARIGNAAFVGDETENALAIYGESCDYCAHEKTENGFILPISLTGKEFNAKQYTRRVTADGEEGFVKVSFPYDTDEPIVKYAERKLVYLKNHDLTVDKSKTYYAVPIDVYGTTGDAYVLIEHNEDNHYYICENGKHVCVGCGEQSSSVHANTATKQTFVRSFGGKDYYAIEYICEYCGESYGIVNGGTHGSSVEVSSIDLSVEGITLDKTSGTVGENYLFMFVFGGKEYFGLGATITGSGNAIIVGVLHDHTDCKYVYDKTSGKFVCKDKTCKAAYEPEHACEERGEITATSFGQDGLPGYVFGKVDTDQKILSHACDKCTTTSPSTEFTVTGEARTAEDLNEALSEYVFFIGGTAYFAKANTLNKATPLEDLREETERVLGTGDTLLAAYDLITVVFVNAETGKEETSLTGYRVRINHICVTYMPYYKDGVLAHRCSACGEFADIGAHEADESKDYVVADYFGTTVVGRPCKHCDQVVPVTFDLGKEQIEYEQYSEGSERGYRAKNMLVTLMREKVGALNISIERMVKYDGTVIYGKTVVPELSADVGNGWRDDAMFRAYSGVVAIDEDGQILDPEQSDGTLYNVFYLRFADAEARSDLSAAVFVKHVCADFVCGTEEGTETEHFCSHCGKQFVSTLKHVPQTKVEADGTEVAVYRLAFTKGLFGEKYAQTEVTVLERKCLVCGGSFCNDVTVNGKDATVKDALDLYTELYAQREIDVTTGETKYLYVELDGKKYKIAGVVKPWAPDEGETEIMSDEDMTFYRPTGKTTDDGVTSGATWNNEAIPLVDNTYYAWEIKAYDVNNENIAITFRMLVAWANPTAR